MVTVNSKPGTGSSSLKDNATQIRRTVSQVIKQLHVPRVIWGVVESIEAGIDSAHAPTLTVTKQATGPPIPGCHFLGSYSPTVGDSVVGFSVAEDYWIIGAVSGGDDTASVVWQTAAGLVNTTSGTYGFPAGGPGVTVLTGTTAEVTLTAESVNSTAGATNYMGFQIGGATPTAGPFDAAALQQSTQSSFSPLLGSATFMVGSLTPGINTFTTLIKTDAGSADFSNRSIIVRP